MKDTLITLRQFSVGYDQQEYVLEDVDLTIHTGDFIAVVGPNGGGKTTLVKSLLQLLKPATGQIAYYIDGKAVDSIEVGYLPQRNQIDTDFPITVCEVVKAGMLSSSNWGWRNRATIRKRVDEVLSQVGMLDYRSRPIGALSGGQLQRVLLARAIVNKPRFIVLDEPNSYLDKQFESQLYPLLQLLNREATLLIVSHEAHSLMPYINRCLRVDHGVYEETVMQDDSESLAHCK